MSHPQPDKTPRTDHQSLAACAECDELLTLPEPGTKGVWACPVCGHRQPARGPLALHQVQALALAALIVAIPANLYPQMQFGLLGRDNSYTLIGGATHLWNNGFWWVSALVLLCTVIAPIVMAGLIFCAATLARLGAGLHRVGPLLRFYRHLATWVMLDVYLLSVIVAVVKLQDMGDFAFTRGFYCFVVMLLLLSAAIGRFHVRALWDQLEARDAGD